MERERERLDKRLRARDWLCKLIELIDSRAWSSIHYDKNVSKYADGGAVLISNAVSASAFRLIDFYALRTSPTILQIDS